MDCGGYAGKCPTVVSVYIVCIFGFDELSLSSARAAAKL